MLKASQKILAVPSSGSNLLRTNASFVKNTYKHEGKTIKLRFVEILLTTKEDVATGGFL